MLVKKEKELEANQYKSNLRTGENRTQTEQLVKTTSLTEEDVKRVDVFLQELKALKSDDRCTTVDYYEITGTNFNLKKDRWRLQPTPVRY